LGRPLRLRSHPSDTSYRVTSVVILPSVRIVNRRRFRWDGAKSAKQDESAWRHCGDDAHGRLDHDGVAEHRADAVDAFDGPCADRNTDGTSLRRGYPSENVKGMGTVKVALARDVSDVPAVGLGITVDGPNAAPPRFFRQRSPGLRQQPSPIRSAIECRLIKASGVDARSRRSSDTSAIDPSGIGFEAVAGHRAVVTN